MNAPDALARARALLADITPLKNDCGRVCGHACCAPDEDGQGGMLLFPGEEIFYSPLPNGFSLVPDTSVIPNGRLLTCSGECARKDRPLACRLFPLLPAQRNGVVRAVRDGRAWAVCPLMECGLGGLNEDFVRAVREVGEALYACPEHAAYLDALHAYILSMRAMRF